MYPASAATSLKEYEPSLSADNVTFTDGNVESSGTNVAFNSPFNKAESIPVIFPVNLAFFASIRVISFVNVSSLPIRFKIFLLGSTI